MHYTQYVKHMLCETHNVLRLPASFVTHIMENTWHTNSRIIYIVSNTIEAAMIVNINNNLEFWINLFAILMGKSDNRRNHKYILLYQIKSLHIFILYILLMITYQRPNSLKLYSILCKIYHMMIQKLFR